MEQQMIERDIALFERPLLSFARSTTMRMALLSGGLILAILQSAVSDGFFSAIVAACAVFGALSAELLVSVVRKHRLLNDLSALASGLVFTLMLPNTINPAFAFAGAFFALVVVKASFGGLGSNWLNPALAGWLFVRFAWPELYTGALAGSQHSAVGTIGGNALPVTGILAGAVQGIVNILNTTVLRIFSCEIPAGFTGFLVNTDANIIADRGVLALVAASVVICAGLHKFRYAVVYLGIYLVLVRLCVMFAPDAAAGDMFYCLFSGGTLLAAFVLCADPATAPKSPAGNIGITALAALLSFVFRYVRGELYGAFFAVAALNVLCPILRDYESKHIYNRIPQEAHP